MKNACLLNDRKNRIEVMQRKLNKYLRFDEAHELLNSI